MDNRIEDAVTSITGLWAWVVVAVVSFDVWRASVQRYGVVGALQVNRKRPKHCAPGRCTRRASVARRERMWAPAHRGPLYSVATVLKLSRLTATYDPDRTITGTIITAERGWTRNVA